MCFGNHWKLTLQNLWPIVYKPHFSIASTPVPLLRAMLCVAASVISEADQDRYDTDKLFQMAEQSVKNCWAQPQLEVVQSILLLSLRQTACGDKQSAFGFTAQACTLALSLGLNNALLSPGDNVEVRAHLLFSQRVPVVSLME